MKKLTTIVPSLFAIMLMLLMTGTTYSAPVGNVATMKANPTSQRSDAEVYTDLAKQYVIFEYDVPLSAFTLECKLSQSRNLATCPVIAKTNQLMPVVVVCNWFNRNVDYPMCSGASAVSP